MTIKLGRHLNLEIEKNNKENEEKLLEQVKKYRRKQFPYVTSQKTTQKSKKVGVFYVGCYCSIVIVSNEHYICTLNLTNWQYILIWLY